MICRVCGCTDLEPCVDDVGRPCAWVDADLCSFCAAGEAEEEPMVRAYSVGELNRYLKGDL